MRYLISFHYEHLNFCSDDEDDEPEPEANNDAELAKDGEGNAVKRESGEASLAQAKASPTELHIYTVDELSRFKKKELLADVTYLEGIVTSFFVPSKLLNLS